jgi:hypothetical protein
MVRSGEYGELRMIRPGSVSGTREYSVLFAGADYDLLSGLGDVSFQATTRGGREMDNVLGGQAAFKGATDATGDVAFSLASQDYGDPMVNLAAMGVGLVLKGISAATKTEADVRCWGNLPHTLEVLPLNLPVGTDRIVIREWSSVIPVAEQSLNVKVDSARPLTVIHVAPPVAAGSVVARILATPDPEITVFYQFLADPTAVDMNGDGELGPQERAEVQERLLAKYDSDADGELSAAERNSAQYQLNTAFTQGMVLE